MHNYVVAEGEIPIDMKELRQKPHMHDHVTFTLHHPVIATKPMGVLALHMGDEEDTILDLLKVKLMWPGL